MSENGPNTYEPFPDPRQLRTLWFASLSQAMEGYMRSAAFLEWMRHVLSVMTETRALQAAAWSSAPPTAALPRPSAPERPALSDPGS